MPKAVLRVTKYAGAAPAIGACTACGRQFKTPVTWLQKVANARASLDEQFERHTCSSKIARAAVEEQFAKVSHVDRAARRLLDPLPLPAYLWEPRTASFLGSNAPFRELTGYSEEEVLRLDWRLLVVPEDQKKGELVITTRPEEDTDQRVWRTKSGAAVRVTRAARLLTFVDDKHSVREAYIALVTHIEGLAKTHSSGLLP